MEWRGFVPGRGKLHLWSLQPLSPGEWILVRELPVAVSVEQIMDRPSASQVSRWAFIHKDLDPHSSFTWQSSLAFSCHSLKIPPPETNLQMITDAGMDMESAMFSFKAPRTINFPSERVCEESQELKTLLAGRMLSDKLEIVASDIFHLKVDAKVRKALLWGGGIAEDKKLVLDTSLDQGEDFIIRNINRHYH